jgi:hypothetical protein
MKNLKRHLVLLIASTLMLVMMFINTAAAKTLSLILDLSGSNPLLIDKHFNQRAAEYVSSQIAPLKKSDVVVIKYVGSLNDTKNFKETRVSITRHNVKKVQRSVGSLIASLPQQMKAQGSTNLIALWGRNNFDCINSGQVIVLTDAIEASEYVSPNALLAGKVSLPKPNELVQLKGCDIQFFGVGVGRSDKEMLTLRRQWKGYFDAAGANFRAITL